MSTTKGALGARVDPMVEGSTEGEPRNASFGQTSERDDQFDQLH